jgi:hypothetical protein
MNAHPEVVEDDTRVDFGQVFTSALEPGMDRELDERVLNPHNDHSNLSPPPRFEEAVAEPPSYEEAVSRI